MSRTQNRIEPEIEQEENGFVQGHWKKKCNLHDQFAVKTKNTDQRIQRMQKNLYIYFIDYTSDIKNYLKC